MHILLLSNSTNAGGSYLEHARDTISSIAGRQPVVFVPFALDDWDDYTDQVRRALPGLDIVGARDHGSIAATVLNAKTVFGGGGNTFRLLAALEQLDLVAPLARRVRAGQCTYPPRQTRLVMVDGDVAHSRPRAEVYPSPALGVGEG